MSARALAKGLHFPALQKCEFILIECDKTTPPVIIRMPLTHDPKTGKHAIQINRLPNSEDQML